MGTLSDQDCSNDQRATVARGNPLKSYVWLVPGAYRACDDADGDASFSIG
jgi:hypothetical protein